MQGVKGAGVNFTKSKFFKLPEMQQHKKCAELLRAIYVCFLESADADALIDKYEEMQGWLNLPPLSFDKRKTIADRYHHHLQIAMQYLKEHNLLPALRCRDKESAEPSWPCSLYLDRLRSAHNVGSILRTAEAFGFGTVYFDEKTPFTDHLQVQQASMGAYQWVESKKITDYSQLPRPLIALETSTDATALHEFIFPENFTLILGNEEYGCSDESLQQADYFIEIPMRGHKNSLNVANAFAVTAGEVYRQRMVDQGGS